MQSVRRSGGAVSSPVEAERKRVRIKGFTWVLWALLLVPGGAGASDDRNAPEGAGDEGPSLARAVICEEIQGRVPVRPAIVFSAEVEQIVCFTRFDPVPERTWIYHDWFRRDRLSRRIRLKLQPPSWDTFSRIQLRENDKGPWRVEISDREGRTLETLRFSITD